MALSLDKCPAKKNDAVAEEDDGNQEHSSGEEAVEDIQKTLPAREV